jgi:hypothetical protein
VPSPCEPPLPSQCEAPREAPLLQCEAPLLDLLCLARYLLHCVRACACACARECVCACACACVRECVCVSEREREVVVSEPFILFLVHNHFITEKFLKKKSGDVNYEANFPFFFLLHKRAKPAPPPYLPSHPPARTQALYSPFTFPLTHPRELKPYTPPLPSLSPTRANSNPILPPYLPSHPPARTQTLYSPL